MREDKIFKAVKGVDDDLICEMLEYSPEEDVNGDVSEGVMYSVPAEGKRTRGLWRYPVTAAAALVIAVGVLFVINNNGGIPDNMSGATSEEAIETAAETDNGEASAADDTDTSSEGTQPTVGEVPAPVVPLKVVNFSGSGDSYLFTDLYPEVPQCDFGEEYFTEMSTLELCEYYGLRNIPYQVKKGVLSEVTDEKTTHGIYTLPDGSVYDINTFTFTTPDDASIGKKFIITVGKKSTFAQEYTKGFKTYYYNEEIKTLFQVIEKNGLCVVISGQTDELSNFDSPLVKESYYECFRPDDKNWEGVPAEAKLFVQNVWICLGDYLD